MSSLHEYKCRKCRYKALAIPDAESGFFAVTQLSVCRNCRNIVDVLVSCNPEQLEPGETIEEPLATFLKNSHCCPRCKSRDYEKWDPELRLCPRCGTKMDVDEGTK
ncbi:MAG: hypothetical protein PHW04_03785 [Candidatus Wallbacteria bacterium]|nr:hypothetical protein [Candidatus Wallbacteria bacterium]